MTKVTLKEFIDKINSLPKNVLDKEISWIDIYYIEHEDLDKLMDKLLDSDEESIKLCN